jgi:aldose 1-epimerase
MLSAEREIGQIDSPLLQIGAGDLSLELAPEIGGSVASFRARNRERFVDLLRPLSAVARRNRDPIGTAMFPMLPYANRIAHNHFQFEGRTYEVAPNAPGQRFNLHGTGWTSEWQVAAIGTDSAVLTLDHIAQHEPYSFSAYQRFEITPNCLRIEIGIVNRGARAMPFGLGLHPWWPRHSEVKLKFSATRFWLEGPEHFPTECISLSSELAFSQSRDLPATWRNNCYSGWDGLAEVLFPGLNTGVRIEADPLFGHLMLYCDPSQHVFCLEPQTHASGALNRPEQSHLGDQGLVVLRPEELLAGVVSFSVFSLESTA